MPPRPWSLVPSDFGVSIFKSNCLYEVASSVFVNTPQLRRNQVIVPIKFSGFQQPCSLAVSGGTCRYPKNGLKKNVIITSNKFRTRTRHLNAVDPNVDHTSIHVYVHFKGLFILWYNCIALSHCTLLQRKCDISVTVLQCQIKFKIEMLCSVTLSCSKQYYQFIVGLSSIIHFY